MTATSRPVGASTLAGALLTMVITLAACADDAPYTSVEREQVGEAPLQDDESTVRVLIGDETESGLAAGVAMEDIGVSASYVAAHHDVERVPQIMMTSMGGVTRPVDLAQRDGDPALYVVSQTGHVVRLVDGNGVVVLDLTDRVNWNNGEMGLLGMVFNPEGDHAYLSYTANDGGALMVIEVPITADGEFQIDDARGLIEIYQPSRFHQGGDLAIGPDALLYIALGDGGPGRDPDRRALALDALLGKIVRIDPAASAELPYTVPADNPYVGVDGARPEIWSSGLRNPWKITFDSATGDLWVADVGEALIEEVNWVRAPADGGIAGRGANFGWSAYEGNERFHLDQPSDGSELAPVLVYEHGEDGCAVTGGVVYRGSAIPDLNSAYLYSDFCSGEIRALFPETGAVVLLAQVLGSTGLIEGIDGEVYVLHKSGLVSRIDPI